MIKVKMTKYLLLAIIALAGMYKSHALADSVSKLQDRKTIYFSKSAGTWFNDVGVCHACTPKNGFGADGSVDDIVWLEFSVSLENDLGEAPDVQEVKSILEDFYLAEWEINYPVHIFRENDIYTILFPVPEELKNFDLLDRRGTLRATYEVTQR